jgi:hypothetical protein
MRRSIRRHHYRRIRRRRQSYWLATEMPLDRRRQGIASRTACVCSCRLCGNPRRFFGDRTRQERRAAESYASGLNDLERHGAREPRKR